jgi:hypothetical protein
VLIIILEVLPCALIAARIYAFPSSSCVEQCRNDPRCASFSLRASILHSPDKVSKIWAYRRVPAFLAVPGPI